MTGFRQRSKSLCTYSAVTRGDLHPVPFFSPAADLRTAGPQEFLFGPIIAQKGKNVKGIPAECMFHIKIDMIAPVFAISVFLYQKPLTK